MIENNNSNAFTIFLMLVLVFLLILELRKAILVLIKKQVHFFFFAQIGLVLLRLYPGDKKKKQKEAMDYYTKNVKTYSVIIAIGSMYFIYIAILVLLSRDRKITFRIRSMLAKQVRPTKFTVEL